MPLSASDYVPINDSEGEEGGSSEADQEDDDNYRKLFSNFTVSVIVKKIIGPLYQFYFKAIKQVFWK